MIAFIAVIQTILFMVHGVIAATAASFFELWKTRQLLAVSSVLGILSLTFVTSSIFAFRSHRGGVKALYRSAAVWLGTVNYLFFGALLCWGIEAVNRLIGEPLTRPSIGAGVLAVSLLASLAAFVNAGRIRLVRLDVSLPNLPDAWKGRQVAVVSDVHLGHVRGVGFLKRLIAMIQREQPDLVVVPGDLYDGTSVDAEALAKPWTELKPPQGILFVTGNHEEFHDVSRFTSTLSAAGVRTLNNEKTDLDGLQVVGIHDGDHRQPARLESLLRGMKLDRSKPSLLLAHSPINLRIAEAAGISLQISGHTHGGQFLPWTWIVDRVYGAFAKGLHALGSLQVLTTVGAGTWGPPMRLGTNPEIVLLRLS